MSLADVFPSSALVNGAIASVLVAAIFAGALLVKSIKDFTRTGPQMRHEVQAHYSGYLVYALGRLMVWTFVLAGLMAAAGCVVYGLLANIFGFRPGLVGFVVAAVTGLAGISTLRFCQTLVWTPALFAASSQYQMRRFARMWRHLSVQGLDVAESLLVLCAVTLTVAAAWVFVAKAAWLDLAFLVIALIAVGAVFRWAFAWHEPLPVRSTRGDAGRPNILMIGSDTLRADRLGAAGYHRELTPFLDQLGESGAQFTHCALAAPGPLRACCRCSPVGHTAIAFATISSPTMKPG
jgi:hypothetical protein